MQFNSTTTAVMTRKSNRCCPSDYLGCSFLHTCPVPVFGLPINTTFGGPRCMSLVPYRPPLHVFETPHTYSFNISGTAFALLIKSCLAPVSSPYLNSVITTTATITITRGIAKVAPRSSSSVLWVSIILHLNGIPSVVSLCPIIPSGWWLKRRRRGGRLYCVITISGPINSHTYGTVTAAALVLVLLLLLHHSLGQSVV